MIRRMQGQEKLFPDPGPGSEEEGDREDSLDDEPAEKDIPDLTPLTQRKLPANFFYKFFTILFHKTHQF